MSERAQPQAGLAQSVGESDAARDKRLQRRTRDMIAEKRRRKNVARTAPPSALELACRRALRQVSDRTAFRITILKLHQVFSCGSYGSSYRTSRIRKPGANPCRGRRERVAGGSVMRVSTSAPPSRVALRARSRSHVLLGKLGPHVVVFSSLPTQTPPLDLDHQVWRSVSDAISSKSICHPGSSSAPRHRPA